MVFGIHLELLFESEWCFNHLSVTKYFDAFLYVANWGTHWFMLRVPRKLVDVDLVRRYCPGESARIHEKGDHIVFEFTSQTEDYDWEEGEGWLSSLISLFGKPCRP